LKGEKKRKTYPSGKAGGGIKEGEHFTVKNLEEGKRMSYVYRLRRKRVER